MYGCLFKTHSKENYFRFLKEIEAKGWRHKATGDDLNCIFKIEFDMHK